MLQAVVTKRQETNIENLQPRTHPRGGFLFLKITITMIALTLAACLSSAMKQQAFITLNNGVVMPQLAAGISLC